MSRLSGRVAVVTGASKGIGAATARALAAEGAAVAVNYASDRDGATRVVADIKDLGGKAVAIQADISKSTDVTRLFDEAKKAFGRIDILVNNAGVFQFSPLEAVTEEEFHRQFNTNVLGMLLSTREAARHIGPEGGSVINIGSVVTALAPPGSSIYTATKSAVAGITRVLANELAPRKIRVNSVSPGGVETEGFHAAGFAGGEFEKQMVAATPLGRLGQTSDIAPVAVFLASADSGWLTGENLFASGGRH